jgi:ABC-2 type transport system permease protein
MTTSETTLGNIQTEKKFRLTIPSWLRNNPIILKELRSRMRGWRSIAGLTGFIALLSLVVSLIYFSVTSLSSMIQVDALRALGRTIFFTVYGIELLMVCMASPALTAGAISTEKEQQTYDLLRTTLLSARDLVFGKLLAAISFILLFMVAAIPLQSMAFIFGGLTVGEVVVSVLILTLTGFAFGAVGIFFSSFISKTRVATAASQITSMVFVIVIPAIALFIILSLDNRFNISQMSDLTQILFFSRIWLVGITSPAVTAVTTEVFLVEEQSLYFITGQLNGGTTVYIPSPWLGFIILYPLIIFVLLYFTIQIVQRAES